MEAFVLKKEIAWEEKVAEETRVVGPVDVSL
jgi:hypothetical protein